MTVRAPFVLALLGVSALALFAQRRPVRTADAMETIVETVKQAVSGPRGIRNNNPGNIVRTADQWRGMAANQSADARFVVFDAPVWGLRALVRVLRKYAAGGLTTVRGIITRWAPAVENDTAAYVDVVASRLGVDPDAPLQLSDHNMARLVEEIVRHENGQQPYPPSLFAEAINLERGA